MTEELTIEYRRLDEVARWPRNVKKHDIGALVESIRRYGMIDPPKLDRTLGALVYGNGRDEALEWMHAQGDDPPRGVRVDDDGMWLIPIKVGLDAPTVEEAEAQALDHNNLTLSGGDFTAFDMARLWGDGYTDILAGLATADALPITVDGDALDGLLKALEPEIVPGDGGDDFDVQPTEGPTRTAMGDLWIIGGVHRLLVGDCTDPANVARLMGGEKAKLTMTSPPYWVGKDYEQEQTWEDIQSFIIRCAAVIAEHTTHRIVINTGAPPAARLTGKRAHVRLLLDDWQSAFDSLGFLMRYVRIWTKRGGLLHTAPESDCIDQHWEFIATFYDPEVYEGQRRVGEPWATEGLWEMHGEMSSGGHTAAFPVEIPRRNILLHTDPGDLIYEPFMGSGVTLIAAHREGRICYGCDVTPKYADTALRRAEAEGLHCERAE